MKTNNSWAPLFLVNFLTVFNDNLLKWLICFISIRWVSSIPESKIIAIASAALVLPFLFFSPLAGRLSVKYSKRDVMVWGKAAEIPIIIAGIVGFSIQSLSLVLIAVLLLGIQSSLISPSKYGLIREVKGDDGISFGTGTMEMLTFLGVLLGTFVASLFSDHYSLIFISLVLISASIASFILSLYLISYQPEKNRSEKESLNPVTFVIKSYKIAKEIKGLNTVILGLSFFWLVGALIQMSLKVYCPTILHLSDTQTGIVMIIAAIGIGAGCLFTGIISKNKVKTSLIPIGGGAMVIFLLIIYFFNPGAIIFSVLIFLVAFSSGVFKVPLNAWIQQNVKGSLLGDILAYENMCEFACILCSSLLFYVFDTRSTFIVLAALSAFIVAILLAKIPGIIRSKH